MEDVRYVNCPPSPLSLIEALRDVGYSMETAVADTIDNSITAGAHRIWIRFSWNFDDPWVAIIDDWSGMLALRCRIMFWVWEFGFNLTSSLRE